MPLGRYNAIDECRSTFCETTPNRTAWKHFKVHYISSGQTPKLSGQVKQKQPAMISSSLVAWF